MNHEAIRNIYPQVVTIDDTAGCFDAEGNIVVIDAALVEAESLRLAELQPQLNCTAEAKSRIAKTDWSVLSDVGLVNVAEFVEYRAILRYLILNPVADPLWPVEPQPVWEAK